MSASVFICSCAHAVASSPFWPHPALALLLLLSVLVVVKGTWAVNLQTKSVCGFICIPA